MKSIPLTWHTAMYTGKGLQAVMKFLEETGVATWTWILGPRDDLVGGFGWSHIRDDGEEGEGEEREERGEATAVEEVVGVG